MAFVRVAMFSRRVNVDLVRFFDCVEKNRMISTRSIVIVNVIMLVYSSSNELVGSSYVQGCLDKTLINGLRVPSKQTLKGLKL